LLLAGAVLLGGCGSRHEAAPPPTTTATTPAPTIHRAPARHVVRTVGVKSAAKNAASSPRSTATRRPAAKKTSAKR